MQPYARCQYTDRSSGARSSGDRARASGARGRRFESSQAHCRRKFAPAESCAAKHRCDLGTCLGIVPTLDGKVRPAAHEVLDGDRPLPLDRMRDLCSGVRPAYVHRRKVLAHRPRPDIGRQAGQGVPGDQPVKRQLSPRDGDHSACADGEDVLARSARCIRRTGGQHPQTGEAKSNSFRSKRTVVDEPARS